MTATLSDILNYTNEDVLARYQKDYPNNKLSAKAAFTEMLKYLWLGRKHYEDKQLNPDNPDLDFSFSMHLEMAEIDDMWHTFLLFTRDYHHFCDQYFNQFIHHQPFSEKDSLPPDVFTLQFSRYLSYVYDHLGKETLECWFASLLADTKETSTTTPANE